MLKILVFDIKKSDVTDMSVKGWKVSIYRDREGGYSGYVTIEKGRVRFTLSHESANDVILKKFVDNTCVDTKKYGTDGVKNCEGTVFINDHTDPKRVYAFWRNKEIQTLMDSAGIEKIAFAKSADKTFDYEIEKTGEGYTFFTDGKVTEEAETNKYKIFGATYLFKTETKELILIQDYDINEISTKLLKDIFG